MPVDVEAVFRAEYGRAIAVLVRFLGDIDLAEEAVQDAFTTAVRRWAETGVPPSPVVALNRAVAVGERQGPRRALGLVDALGLDDHHVWHAVRADLLRRLHRTPEAVRAYEAALALTSSPAERAFLDRRLRELTT
ncbi:hypothetical protein ACF05L_21090 [Streptomyces bobili]|uniref:hypothetical protein n=1 Tax=Streptomyces bobili TaxID=67280 RepID=UPI003700388E